jgi:class 3 adenylate cyclase
VICPNCGTENNAAARFCMECATPFSAKCPNCGTVNPPQAKFCSECATPLAAARSSTPASAHRAAAVIQPGAAPAPAAVAERRLVSVLFADLVGFTTFSDGRDAEEVRDLQSRYFDTVSEIIRRYGGTVEKFIGDAVMALWGAPVAHEDDAERAVRAALDLVDTVRSLAPGIEARAGVLTDEAAVTIGATNQGMVTGDTVNTASRLQSVAAPSTVLVGEGTVHAAGGAIVFERADDQLLKGKASPVPAWRAVRIVAQRGGIGRSETLEAPFVGRDDELRQLKEQYHSTSREGRARLVSVVGPGGIGKSRLAWEFRKYMDGLVEVVWWHEGRSPAYGDGITFWALGEMIRGRAGLQESDDEATTRARIAAMLERHVPDASEREWIEPALLSLLGVEQAAAVQGSQQLFGAWRTFFERMAATGPVVMVFEDLHNSDPGLLDFIDHVLEWSRALPILIVTLARPELMDKRPDFGAGKRNFTSIYLEPLPTEAMRELLDGLVPGLPQATRDAIVERADGIPLYAVETVRMLLAQDKLVVEAGVYRVAGDLTELAVPESLTALISARLDELDPAGRSLVADAAVLGQSFTLAALSAVSGLDEASLDPALRALVRRELLVQQVDPRSPERGQFAFVQALIREVAYNTLAKRDRKVRHLAAARFFESLETDELAGALAGHYLAAHSYAADGPEADALAAQARVALRGAAERAAVLGSDAQAIALLERALTVSPAATDRADLHDRALNSAMRGLDLDVATRHGAAALEARRELGDRHMTALAAGNYAKALLHPAAASSGAARQFLAEVWPEFSDLEQTDAGAGLMLLLARTEARDNDPQMFAWIERMLPIAERLRMIPEITEALVMRGTGLIRTQRPAEAMMLLRGAHEMALASNLESVHRRSRTLLCFYEQFDDPAVGLTLAREGLEYASRTGSAAYGFLMVGNGAVCALRVGEWAWARQLIDEWLANEVGSQAFSEHFADRAVFRALSGEDPQPDIAAAEERLAGAEDSQFQTYFHWAKAWAALANGEFDLATAEAVAAFDITRYFGPLVLPLAVRAALWRGDAETARQRLDELDQAFRGAQAATMLDVTTLRAGLAAVNGRRAEAISGYREALNGWKQLGCGFEEALAAIDMATLLKPTEREMAEAAGLLEDARQALVRMDAKALLARLDSAMADASVERSTAEPPASTVPVTA